MLSLPLQTKELPNNPCQTLHTILTQYAAVLCCLLKELTHYSRHVKLIDVTTFFLKMPVHPYITIVLYKADIYSVRCSCTLYSTLLFVPIDPPTPSTNVQYKCTSTSTRWIQISAAQCLPLDNTKIYKEL